MINLFKKASTERLLSYVQKAVNILTERGIYIRVHARTN